MSKVQDIVHMQIYRWFRQLKALSMNNQKLAGCGN